MDAPPLDQIRQLVQEIVESERMDLVDVEFKAGKSRSLLRIFIDKEGGVTLADCETVSRHLSAVLDVKDLLKNAYVLEVSSPGMDRPFRTDRDYRRSLGRQVRLFLEDREIVGKLIEVGDTELALETAGGKMCTIARDSIRRAQQDIAFPAHPKPGRRKRK